MMGYADAPRAFWTTLGMARVAGVNLSRAVVDGWLTRREMGELVLACDTCDKSRDCTAWLATATSGPLPDFCCNKTAIEALRV